MAQKKPGASGEKSTKGWRPNGQRRKAKKTSIGHSKNSRPTNKRKKRCHGKHPYRGQGR